MGLITIKSDRLIIDHLGNLCNRLQTSYINLCIVIDCNQLLDNFYSNNNLLIYNSFKINYDYM